MARHLPYRFAAALFLLQPPRLPLAPSCHPAPDRGSCLPILGCPRSRDHHRASHEESSRAALYRPGRSGYLPSRRALRSSLSPPIATLFERFSAATSSVGCYWAQYRPSAPWVRMDDGSFSVFVAYPIIPLAGVTGSPYSIARIFNWIMFAPLAFLLADRVGGYSLLRRWVGTVLVLLGVGLQLTGILGFTWGGLGLCRKWPV